jgi:hypothetical protein
MYLIGAALGALVAMFLLSRFLRWALSKARFAGRGAIVIAHAASLTLAVAVAGFAFGDGGSGQVAIAAALYGIATAIFLGRDLLTFRTAWYQRPVRQVI